MKKLLLALTLVGGLTSAARAGDVVYNADLVYDTCLAIDANYDLNLRLPGIQTLSFVATYSTTTPASKTFTDGTKSTATITVSSNTAITALIGFLNVTVASFSATGLSDLTLNGIKFHEGAGQSWTKVATATGSAEALRVAINAHADFSAVRTSTVITVTSVSSGVFVNGWTCTSSTPAALTCGAATFAGGQDNVWLAVQGYGFRAGTEFSVGNTSTDTAKNISAALMANATLAALFTSTWNVGGIVSATSTLSGVNAYTLFTSSNSALRLNNSATLNSDTFKNGTVSKLDLTNDLATVLAHGYNTGLAVLFSTAASPGITGLVGGTTYYVIKNDYDRIGFATTKANASAGTDIDITAEAGGKTYTLTPLVISGSPGFKWQASNDGTNFTDLAVSSVTVTSASSTAWDFGTVNYSVLRLKYTAPTTGGTNLRAAGTGRK